VQQKNKNWEDEMAGLLAMGVYGPEWMSLERNACSLRGGVKADAFKDGKQLSPDNFWHSDTEIPRVAPLYSTLVRGNRMGVRDVRILSFMGDMHVLEDEEKFMTHLKESKQEESEEEESKEEESKQEESKEEESKPKESKQEESKEEEFFRKVSDSVKASKQTACKRASVKCNKGWYRYSKIHSIMHARTSLRRY
jgi:hypothetical protein